jgi:hypothetical protein
VELAVDAGGEPAGHTVALVLQDPAASTQASSPVLNPVQL